MMEIDISSDALDRICNQLGLPAMQSRQNATRTAHKDVLREGWGLPNDLEDILGETDRRAEELARKNDFDCLLTSYKLRWISCYRRPSSTAKEAWGGPAMRAADLAMFVMEIERLGFAVDAEPLVAGLRPAVLKQKHVTQSELAILWYSRDRHRLEPIVLKAAGHPNRVETIVTERGYKATMILEDLHPVALRVDPPNDRKGFPLKYWIPLQMKHASH